MNALSNNMDNTEKQNAELKKPDIKEPKWHDSIHVKFENRQN